MPAYQLRRSILTGIWPGLILAAVTLSALAFIFAATVNSSPCANAATTCPVGDTETIASGLSVNDDGTADGDFRVETFTEANAIFVDASADTAAVNVALTLGADLFAGATPSAGVANQVLVSSGPGASPEWGAYNPLIYSNATSADNTRTSTTTVASLSTPWTWTGAVNTVYSVEILALMDDDSGGTADMDFTFAMPASATFNCGVNSSATGAIVTPETGSSGTEVAVALTNATDAFLVHIRCVVEVAGTGGAIDWQFAQGTGSGSAVTLRQGSTIAVREF